MLLNAVVVQPFLIHAIPCVRETRGERTEGETVGG